MLNIVYCRVISCRWYAVSHSDNVFNKVKSMWKSTLLVTQRGLRTEFFGILEFPPLCIPCIPHINLAFKSLYLSLETALKSVE